MSSSGSSVNPSVEDIAKKVLGTKTGEYKNYDPSVLVAIPRNLSIEYLGTTMEDLKGEGFDVWYSYEFRTLTDQGLPIASALKFIIPHTSKNIIESKSFKLYCNSFTAEHMGTTKEKALKRCCEIMKKDLSEKTEDNVEVSVVTYKDKREIFNGFVDLMDIVDPKMTVTKYNEDPSQLEIEEELKEELKGELKEYRLKFDALRSKCRITNQPDSGTAYIYYKSKKHIKEESLVRYLSSFYSENHFHEECLITLFLRLKNILNPEDKLVTVALYQRRGSLDIGPVHYQNCDSFELSELDIQSDLDFLKQNNIFAYDSTNIYR